MNNPSSTANSSPPLPADRPITKRVLVIDDDFIMRTLIRRWLERDEIGVDEAFDGQDAWEKIEQGLRPDLTLLDIVMPRLDGIGFLQRLQQNQINLKTITLSGSHENIDLTVLAALGSRRHLTKPLSREELMAVIHDLLTGGSDCANP